MSQQIFDEADKRMGKSIESLQGELSRIRTGRAHPGLLEHIQVSYYGNVVPLNQAANINVTDARTLTVTPWDKNTIPDIEKAITSSDLGLNPVTAGVAIRIPLPPLTEERRKELIKVVRAEVEKARVAIRNIRRDANARLKEQLKGKEITKDDERRDGEKIQALTDSHIKQVEKMLAAKETELMEI
ncbi:MAG: ribosome recycling factor [Gammaproteobacteria bacterium]